MGIELGKPLLENRDEPQSSDSNSPSSPQSSAVQHQLSSPESSTNRQAQYPVGSSTDRISTSLSQSCATGQPLSSPKSCASGQPLSSQNFTSGQPLSSPQSGANSSVGLPTHHDQQNKNTQISGEPYEATTETVNFCKLARLILDVCNAAMRDLLRCKISGGELILTQTLKNKKEIIQKNCRLSNIQKKIIFPPNNGLVKYTKLDFTLMYLIVRNVCPDKIEPNSQKSKWGGKPQAKVTSLLAAIEKIRECRNEFFAHATEAKICDSEFKDLWDSLEQALLKIDDNLDKTVVSTSYKTEMKEIRKMQIDPESNRRLQQLTEKDGLLKVLKAKDDEMNQKLEELMSMLGSRKVMGTKDANIGQTEVFLATFIEQNEFYVATKLLEEVETILKQRKCVFIVGKEGTGKTATAVHLMFRHIQQKNCFVRKLHAPQDFSSYVDPTKNQLIFIDDIFDQCSKHTLQGWWNVFRLIDSFLSGGSKVQIIMTSRPHKLKYALSKMKYNNNLLKECKVDFDSKVLDLKEKKEILQKKMKFANSVYQTEEINFSDEQWTHISSSSPPFGFPLCAHLFACDSTCRKDGIEFFTNPKNHLLSEVRSIIEADATRRTEVLFVLILVHQIQNVSFDYKNSDICWKVLEQLQITKELQLNEEHVDQLGGTVKDHQDKFVIEFGKNRLQFSHPSVQDAVQNYFFEKYPKKAIEILPMNILYHKVHKEYFLSLTAELQTCFMQRLRLEIKRGNMSEVCRFEQLNDSYVSNAFLKEVIVDVKEFKDLLETKDGDGTPFIYWFTVGACNETVINMLRHDTMNLVCSEMELDEQHFYSLLASCVLTEKLEIMEYILQKYSNRYIQNHRSKCLTPPLLVAVKEKNKSGMQLLLKNETVFPDATWKGWPFLHACAIYNEFQICSTDILETVLAFESKTHSVENEYKMITSIEKSVFEKIVDKVHSSVVKHGSHKHLLLCLVEISELEITDELIKAFCSLADVKGITDLHPINFVDEMGESVLHLLLKYRWYNHGELTISNDGKDDCSENEISDVSVEGKVGSCHLPEESQVPYEAENFFVYRKIEDKNKHLQTIRRLCVNKANVNMKNKRGETPLMIELNKTKPSIEVLRSLLHYGANPNDHDILGQTCFHKLLLQNCDSNINVRAILDILVQHGLDVNKQDNQGNSPIFLELKRQNPRTEILSFMMNAGINIKLLDSNGQTALHVALKKPDYDHANNNKIVEILLCSKGSSVLVRNRNDESAFSIAISYVKRNSEILTQIALHESCEFPLHECIKEQVAEDAKIQALQFFLSNEAEKLNKHALNGEKETMLITAAKTCPEMVTLFQFLLSQDININARDICQKTALDYLIESSNEFEFKRRKATIICLLAKMSEVMVKSEKEKPPSSLLTVMHFLMSKSYLRQTDPLMATFDTSEHIRKESQTNVPVNQKLKQTKDVFVDTEIILKILETTTADLNSYVGEKGRTYLHYCSTTCFDSEHMPAICARLIELGVDVNKKDNDGFTCLDVAFKHTGKENFHTVVYLLNRINLQELDVDKSLQYLADGNNLYGDIVKYFKENIFEQRKPTKNCLHYLASINYNPDPKYLNKIEREELFNQLQSCFRVDEENADQRIPLHVAIEVNSNVSCVLNFLRISASCINKADCDDNTALHLVLKSDREDSAVCTIVKQMLQYQADVNAQNELLRTPLMVAVMCLKDRSGTISEILKMKPDLNLKDRSGLSIIHHCIETQKDDFTACALLTLFLESGLSISLTSKTNGKNTALNLAAKTIRYSRILCILKLLQTKSCSVATVDNGGRSPSYNSAANLPGMNPLVVLERLIRSYIFLIHGDDPYCQTDKKDTMFDVCTRSQYRYLVDLLKTDINDKDAVYSIFQRALIDVSRQVFEKQSFEIDDVFQWHDLPIEERMQTVISDSVTYLSHCRLDLLKNEGPVEDYDNQSSALDYEH